MFIVLDGVHDAFLIGQKWKLSLSVVASDPCHASNAPAPFALQWFPGGRAHGGWIGCFVPALSSYTCRILVNSVLFCFFSFFSHFFFFTFFTFFFLFLLFFLYSCMPSHARLGALTSRDVQYVTVLFNDPRTDAHGDRPPIHPTRPPAHPPTDSPPLTPPRVYQSVGIDLSFVGGRILSEEYDNDLYICTSSI